MPPCAARWRRWTAIARSPPTSSASPAACAPAGSIRRHRDGCPGDPRATRRREVVQGVDPGGGAPHADEQSRSRRGRAAARPRGLRRHGGGGAQRHFGGSLKGRLVLTGGLGGMGGAQPLAATMRGAVCLAVEVDPGRVQRRRDTRYLDRSTASLDEALRWCETARRDGEALSVGLIGNCADVLPELARRGFVPDVLTDQTSAHDPLNGYVPAGCSLEQAAALRQADPAEYVRRATGSIVTHVRAMLELRRQGAVTFDYGNNIRTQAADAGLEQAFAIPGFVPEYIRPLFCEGKGPFRWVALSGEARDLQRTDRLALELFPENEHLRRWIGLAQARVAFQGLPARICWLGQGERARFGCALNDLVKRGELAAPIVIGRDHLDTGSVASPFRETEGMRDGSDAIADWPILNALRIGQSAI